MPLNWLQFACLTCLELHVQEAFQSLHFPNENSILNPEPIDFVTHFLLALLHSNKIFMDDVQYAWIALTSQL